MKKFITITCTKFYWEDEMSRTCSTHEEDEGCLQNWSCKAWVEESDRASKQWWDNNIKINLNIWAMCSCGLYLNGSG